MYREPTRTVKKFSFYQDTLLVKSDGQDREIDIQVAQQTFKRLAENGETRIDQLDNDLRQKFEWTKEMFHALSDNPGVYAQMRKICLEIFEKYSSGVVSSGTVNAYFLGCTSRLEGYNGDSDSSPLCLGALQPPSGTPGYEVSKHGAYEVRSGTLVQTHPPMDGKAYVISESEMKELSPEMRQKLKSDGVVEYSLIWMDESGIRSQEKMRRIDATSLDEMQNVIRNAGKQPSSSGNTGSQVWLCILFVVLLVLVLLIIVMGIAVAFWNKRSKKPSTAAHPVVMYEQVNEIVV